MHPDVPDRWNLSEEQPKGFDDRTVTGLMAAYTGHQYTEEEIWQFKLRADDIHSQEMTALRPRAASIRAFDIPALAGITVQFERLADLNGVLIARLQIALPCVQWGALAISMLCVKKYGLLHEHVPAPMDETTQQPMVVELVGRVRAVNGQEDALAWRRAVREATDWKTNDTVNLGSVTLEIERATYANTSNPSIGVSFYL